MGLMTEVSSPRLLREGGEITEIKAWLSKHKDTAALVQIETGGNQDYVFGSRRRVEHVGASELTYRAGIHWPLREANLRVSGPSLDDCLKRAYSDDYLPVVCSSGKAIYLCRTKELARELLNKVTRKALEEAPGLDISGTVLEFVPGTRLCEQLDNLARLQAKAKQSGSASLGRFLRLPFSEQCLPTGSRASGMVEWGKEEAKPLSAASLIKRWVSDDARERIKVALDHPVTEETLESYLEFGDPRDSSTQLYRILVSSLDFFYQKEAAQNEAEQDEEQEGQDWHGVIHIDGNDFGKTFRCLFGKGSKWEGAEYIWTLRSFSRELDLLVGRAAAKATLDTNTLKRQSKKDDSSKKEGPREQENPPLNILPLIIGGDDVTVLVEGEYALHWTEVFLKSFSFYSLNREYHPTLARCRTEGLTACAGVAIVKSHFPFITAYNLAEELIKSAKQIRETSGGSWLDFHVVYDTSSITLKSIRDRLKVRSNLLTLRPYHLEAEPSEPRSWQGLKDRVKALKEFGKLTPIQQMRTDVHLGEKASDERFRILQKRMREEQDKELLSTVLADPIKRDSLWTTIKVPSKLAAKDEASETEEAKATAVLDVIDAKDFLWDTVSDILSSPVDQESEQ